MKQQILLALLGLTAVLAAPKADLFTQLPDCPPFTYNAFSGYLKAAETRSLHYIFIQSDSDPVNDPVLLWFNGGPGCSSLLGFFQEHGPYIIDDGQTHIKENPYPWNARANVVYIESPAGVGFSYAATPADLVQDDQTQSEDVYAALLDFYVKYPQFLANDLYISGESYAGIYVPYLAWQIDQHNVLPDAVVINLKGYLVGNGATDFTVDVSPSFPQTVYNMNIIKKDLYDTYESNNCFNSFNDVLPATDTQVCKDAWDQINVLAQNLNWYDLYRPVYDSAITLRDENRIGEVEIGGVKKTYKRGYTMQEYTPWLKNANIRSPLLGDYVSDYANRADVRAALNIPDTIQAWEGCSSTLQYTPLTKGSLWIYPELQNKYKIMFYSGDTDGAVPTYGSRLWIMGLGWAELEDGKWRPWYTNGQISGYVQNFDGLDFVTIHGVGHMAPQWKRQDTTEMIMAWIHNESFFP